MSNLVAEKLTELSHSLQYLGATDFGFVARVVGLTIETRGLKAAMGSVCEIERESGAPIEAQVVGFSGETTFMMAFGETSGINLGAKVRKTAEADIALVGESALGRVLDARGHPLDGLPPLSGLRATPMLGTPVNPMERVPIENTLDVGVRAVNALLTVGCGQRIGVIAGSGVGKSVLLGMMTKYSQADVIVIGLIGERGREVKEFIEQILGVEGLRRSVVIAAPADNSPLERIRAAHLAHSYAEFFKANGANVLLLLDSLTRVAHAQREIGLAVGEAPTTKGYTPSVIGLLPKLIERTGTGSEGEGTITAFYTVLAEGDDLNDPVVDIARASLDGQIALSRDLADQGHFPAIDLVGSVSRLMPVLASDEQIENALRFRKIWSTYQENKELVQVGAYQRGSDHHMDTALRTITQITDFLTQKMTEASSAEESMTALRELVHEF
jgi:flagellum-specific ATP synthase